MSGTLEVITGCMFSGKTEELIRRLHRLEYGPQRYVLIKPTTDTRYGKTKVSTHYGREMDGFLLVPGEETLSKLVGTISENRFRGASVFAFDEAQFFSERFPILCEALVAEGKRVVVAGLNLDFRGQPFGPMPIVMALADKVDVLTAICVKCGKPATRTQRLVDGKPAPLDGPVIKVGGAETYEARCRDCWNIPASAEELSLDIGN